MRQHARLRPWLPLLAVAGLLAAAAVAATLSAPEITDVPLPPAQRAGPLLPPGGSQPSGAPSPTLLDTSSRDVLRLPGWLQYLVLGLCLALFVVTVLVLVWALLRDRMSVRRGALSVEQGAAAARSRTEEVVAALDAGLSDLSDADRDPRRAVIACWVRLEQAAAAAGTPRRIGDAPADLVLRLLSAHQVDRQVLDRFAGIYREARYATHVIDDDMRTQAQAALRHLRTELTVSTVAPP